MLFCIMARKVPNICSRDFCVFENGKQFFKVTSERFRNFNVALDETKQRSFLYRLKDVSFGDGEETKKGVVDWKALTDKETQLEMLLFLLFPITLPHFHDFDTDRLF